MLFSQFLNDMRKILYSFETKKCKKAAGKRRPPVHSGDDS